MKKQKLLICTEIRLGRIHTWHSIEQFILGLHSCTNFCQFYWSKFWRKMANVFCDVTWFTGNNINTTHQAFLYMGWKHLCAARFFCGLMHQGSSYPLFQIILSNWLHPDERGCYSIISCVCWLKSWYRFNVDIWWCYCRFVNWMARYILRIWWNWFCLVCFLVALYYSETPAECKGISADERNYLSNITDRNRTKNYPTPWKDIFTSIPYWATVFAQTTGS